MGYRSTFITEDAYYELPKWFHDKWKSSVNFGEHTDKTHINPLPNGPCFPLSSKWERKFYSGAEDELFVDLSKVLKETGREYPLTVVLLHEDGEVDRLIITNKDITLQRSLKYDEDDDYNPQLGNSEKFVVEGNNHVTNG